MNAHQKQAFQSNIATFTERRVDMLEMGLEVLLNAHFLDASENSITLKALYKFRYDPAPVMDRLERLSIPVAEKILDTLNMGIQRAALTPTSLNEIVNNTIDRFIFHQCLDKKGLLGVSTAAQQELVMHCLAAPKSVFTLIFSKYQTATQYQLYKVLEDLLYNCLRKLYYLEQYHMALFYFDLPVHKYTVIAQKLAMRVNLQHHLVQLRNESDLKYKVVSYGLASVIEHMQTIYTEMIAMADYTPAQGVKIDPSPHFSFLSFILGSSDIDKGVKTAIEAEMCQLLTKLYTFFQTGDILNAPSLSAQNDE